MSDDAILGETLGKFLIEAERDRLIAFTAPDARHSLRSVWIGFIVEVTDECAASERGQIKCNGQ